MSKAQYSIYIHNPRASNYYAMERPFRMDQLLRNGLLKLNTKTQESEWFECCPRIHLEFSSSNMPVNSVATYFGKWDVAVGSTTQIYTYD